MATYRNVGIKEEMRGGLLTTTARAARTPCSASVDVSVILVRRIVNVNHQPSLGCSD